MDCLYKVPVRLKEPVLIGEVMYSTIMVKCGKCETCLQRRVAEWSFRIEQEVKESKCSHFVTLTYEPGKVKWKYGEMILVKKHLQKFFKRLRINSERSKKVTWEMFYHGLNPKKDKIKYYACGEYGEKYGRPHYHAIILNASKEMIEKSWKKGKVDIRECNSARIAYVLKYMNKLYNKSRDRLKPKEFNIQSINLGGSFIEKMKGFYQKNPEINYMVNDRGIKVPLAKYYNDRMLSEEQRRYKAGLIQSRLDEQTKDDIARLGEEAYRDLREMKQREIKRRFARAHKKRDM